MNDLDNLKALAEAMKKAIDINFAIARAALELANLTIDENARLRAEMTRMERERREVGAFGFKPMGVRS